MTLLAPLMLAGAAAAAIPLALHFFYRARYKPKPWGAMKFLRLSIEQTSRRLKFQEWILLALRILLLLLLAFALARPASSSLSGIGRGDSVDAIFLIDVSASMGARDGDVTRLRRAVESANRVLDQLPANSTVQLIAVAEDAEVLGPRSPGNFDQARVLLNDIEPTDRATDFLGAFTEAVAAFDRGSLPNKEVYLFSDLQSSGWERQPEALRAKAGEIDQRGTLYLVRCGESEPRNVTLVDLIPSGGIPHAGNRAAYSALIRNSGTEPVNNVTVTLEVAGKPLEKETQAVPQIGPGETRAVPLTAKLDVAGQTILKARLGADDLEADNQLDKIVPVRDQVRVLVIDGNPTPDQPEDAASFFLTHTLRPVPEPDWPGYHVQPRVVAPRDAAPALLADQDVCILADVPLGFGGGALPLSDGFLERLRRFVREGGGLIIGCGPRVDPTAYNARLGRGGMDLLPFPLGEPFEAPDDELLHPAPDSADLSSYVAGFREEPLNQVGLAAFLKALGVSEGDSSSAGDQGGRVLLRFGDGRPMVVSREVGDGEVILVTSSLAADWTDWPMGVREHSYVPFVQLTLSHLLEESAAAYNLTAGETFSWRPPDNQQEYTVVWPDGTEDPQGKPGGTADDWINLRYSETDRAGVYRVVPSKSGPTVAFAVTPDVAESENLDSYPNEQIDSDLGFSPVHLNAGADLSETAGEFRLRREWTVWALLALFLLTFGETFWAWVCGRPVG